MNAAPRGRRFSSDPAAILDRMRVIDIGWMMSESLRQSDLDDLSAWMDGEVEGRRAVEIERLVAAVPAWRRAHGELVALNSALDAWAAPPPPADLAERTIRRARASRTAVGKARRMACWLVPAGVAAAALLLVVMARGPRDDSAGQRRQAAQVAPEAGAEIVATVLGDLPPGDRFLVENLDFFTGYDLCDLMAANETLLDVETLAALDRLDPRGI